MIKEKIKFYSDKENIFITGNGTSAIYLALKASNLPKGSKIAVPNISCPDPVYALIWAGYKPIFIDVNMDDYNMSTIHLEEKLQSDRTIKGIIAIHLFGNSCDIVNIKKLSKKYNCFLIEDSAQSFGNEIESGKLGSFGDVSIFSFGSGKIIEAGHGGSIQTDDKKLFEKIKEEYLKLPKYNNKKIEKLSKLHRLIYYKLYYLGIKYPRLNILNYIYVYFFKNYYLYRLEERYLKLLSDGLKKFNQNKKDRISLINSYLDELKNLSNIKSPKLNNRENILSRLTVVVDKSEKVSKEIRDKNISSNTMYPMLIDRFKLFFDKQEYINSYLLKGKLLNLWSNNISEQELSSTLKIIKDINE